jgi:peptide/nickel transport system ATP-binding protein
VEELHVAFVADRGEMVHAVNGVSFALAPSGTLAILGESGSGKTVTLRSVLRLNPEPRARYRGAIYYQGRNILALPQAELPRIRGREIAMVFQNAMTALNPVATIGSQIVRTLCAHRGISARDAVAEAIELLRLVHIPLPERRLQAYPHELSGGMRQRAMIAMALACRPKVLLADEPTTALDVTVQAQVIDLLKELQATFHMAIVLVTHDVGVAAEVADDVVVMYAGRVVEAGPLRTVLRAPAHPYTQGLLEANVTGRHRGPLVTIPGQPPDLAELPRGCAFGPRCRYVAPTCEQAMPGLSAVAPGHTARCVLVEPSGIPPISA